MLFIIKLWLCSGDFPILVDNEVGSSPDINDFCFSQSLSILKLQMQIYVAFLER